MTTPPRPDQVPHVPRGTALSPGGLTGGAQLVGIPPAVPAISTSSQTFKGAGTYTLHTFAAAGRVWLASCSGALEANAGYGGGLDNESVTIKMGSGAILALMELAVTVANQIDSKQSDVNWNGIPIASGDTLQLVITTPTTGVVIRASGFVAYSIP